MGCIIANFSMKIISRRLKKEGIIQILPIALLLIVVVAMFIPVAKAGFDWIDNGRMVLESRELHASVVNLDFSEMFDVLVEKRIGRFRPFYWIWNALVYRVAGDSAGLHYYFRFLLIFGTSFLIYKTVNMISKSKLAGIISSFLFILIPINTNNWYNLGPQEPLLGFLLITSIYIFLRYKNVAFASLFLLFAFFTKETSIALVPALIILYLAKVITGSRDKKLEKYIFSSLLLLATVLLITFSIRRGYSLSYVFDFKESFIRFESYVNIARKNIPLLSIFLYTFLIRNSCAFFNKGLKKIKALDISALFFLMIFISYLAVQSPWIWVMERYMLPATIAATIFIGLELKRVLSILESKSKTVASLAMVILAIASIFYFSDNILRIITLGQRVSHGTRNLQEMFAYVSENIKDEGTVYLNFVENEGTYEPLREMDRHLDLFYNQSDIVVKYLGERNLDEAEYTIVSGPRLKPPYITDEDLKEENIAGSIEKIETTSEIIIFTTPINVVKQLVKKVWALLLRREKITPDGIYTYHILKHHWIFYSVNQIESEKDER